MKAWLRLLPRALAVVLATPALGAARAQGASGTDVPPEPPPLVLENSFCRLEVDPVHGRLLRVLDLRGRIDLQSPPELAENFRLMIPAPDAARNFVLGRDQRLTRVESRPTALELHWAGPMKDERGTLRNLDATLRVELNEQAVAFRFFLTNRASERVAEVWYPALGGLHRFGPAEHATKATLNPPPNHARRFSSAPFGQHLAHYPSQNLGFMHIFQPELNRGLYLGAHDSIARLKGFFFVEQTAGAARNITAWLIHYPFTPAGQVFEGAPLVARFQDGDWVRAGREIYRPWFIETFGLMKPEDDWIRQQGFFQMIMILLPEGNVNYRLDQIPQLARDGLKYGLTSLQIAGWQRGGHDNGYPYYEPDPRLGTWRDLKKALRECHELGVKVYFFANILVNNLDTAWYQRELAQYNFETLKGHAAWIDGWGMGTLASRMKLTTPLMAFSDVSFPALADAHLEYFKKLAAAGADGLHLDKCYPSLLNFNPRVPLSPDQAPWEGTLRLVGRISRECRALHPEFRLSFETTYDRLLSFGAATWWAGNLSVARQVFPELVETVGLYQPYDYLGVNDAVRNGHAVMVAPFHFNRSMDCPEWRGLAGYIRDVKSIRDELARYVFTGEPVDAGEAELDLSRLPAGIEHATYRNPDNGRRACIITHRGQMPATVRFTGFAGARAARVRLYAPARTPRVLTTPAEIEVEGERLVFVVEQ